MFQEGLRRRIELVVLEFGFNLARENQDLLEYSSMDVVLRFAFDRRERSLNLFIGNSDENLVLLDQDILFQVFGSTEKIERVPVDQFVDGVIKFFENKGVALLSGDKDSMERLLDYQEERSERYTAQLREGQRHS